MSRLQENLDEILRQKQTYLKPENIRQGITAFGIEGQMISENMWLPQYASEGDYYILSFVNLDGNSNVERIVGQDGYRIVKFRGDTRMYLFDVRMNKPKQISNSLPTDAGNLLGYTDECVYFLNNTHKSNTVLKVYKYNLSTEQITYITSTISGNYTRIPMNDVGNGLFVKDFYMYAGCSSSGNMYGGLLHYNVNTDTIEQLAYSTGASTYGYGYLDNSYSTNMPNGFCSGMTVTNSHIIMIRTGWVSDYTDVICYDKITKAVKTYRIDTRSSATNRGVHGISLSGNYIFVGSKIYNFDADIGVGAEVGNTPFSNGGYTTDSYVIKWVTSSVCVYNNMLYTFNEETLMFTKIVDTTFEYSKISSTYLDVIVGYEFLGKTYNFNIGNPIIKSDKILDGYFARDQYNQKVQGTIPNRGNITIKPSTETQIIAEGYVSSITVNPVTYEIDADIKPENIRYGVNILGVAGTLEQDAAESVMSQEEYDACVSVANNILGLTE